MLKRIVSVGLVLMMILSLMAVGIVTGHAESSWYEKNDSNGVTLGVFVPKDYIKDTYNTVSPYSVFLRVKASNGFDNVQGLGLSDDGEYFYGVEYIDKGWFPILSVSLVYLGEETDITEIGYKEVFSDYFLYMENGTSSVRNTSLFYENTDNAHMVEILYAPNDIKVSANNGRSKVALTTDTANLRVTVPTVLPVNVDSNNNVTVADNAQISNLSNGSVDVTNAEIQTDEWSVVGFNTDFTKVPVDTKQYGFKLNGDDVSDGVNTSVFNTINGNNHIGLLYDANVAVQSQPITNEDIGRIVFTVAWHK